MDNDSTFHRFPLKYIQANMYLAIEGEKALIIDPSCSDEAMELLKEAGVKDLTILLTHEHFDHISGVNWFKRNFPTKVICQKACAKYIADEENNFPWTFFALMCPEAKGHEEEVEVYCNSLPQEAISTDVTFENEYGFCWGGHTLYLLSMPGHSQGSMIAKFDDIYLFSGDYMILDMPVLLTLPGGSRKSYKKHTLPYLLSLDNKYRIMPGHGEPYFAKSLRYENGIFTKS